MSVLPPTADVGTPTAQPVSCQKRSIANFHLTQIQIASGKTHIQKNCPQLSRSEVISRPPILNLSADRSRSRSTSIYDNPSTAHLTGLQAPAMLSVHAALDHIAIAVVSVQIAGVIRIIAIRIVVIVVIRVEAEGETSPEAAIMKSTESTAAKSTSMETTATMESASDAAAMETASSETATVKAATVETAAAHAAAVKTATAAPKAAAAHAAPVATTSTKAAAAPVATATTSSAATSQRHRWRNQANGRNCQ
jgi:hypothetical protein